MVLDGECQLSNLSLDWKLSLPVASFPEDDCFSAHSLSRSSLLFWRHKPRCQIGNRLGTQLPRVLEVKHLLDFKMLAILDQGIEQAWMRANCASGRVYVPKAETLTETSFRLNFSPSLCFCS